MLWIWLFWKQSGDSDDTEEYSDRGDYGKSCYPSEYGGLGDSQDSHET